MIYPRQIQSLEQATPVWSFYPSMTSLPLNSVIARVDCITDRMLYVKGYALAGSSGDVKAVELTLDEGKSWQPAKIIYQESKWSWTIWEAEVECSADNGTLFSRAIDARDNAQPKDGVWNLRGVAYNGWGRGTWHRDIV
jgi:sulfite oxidase